MKSISVSLLFLAASCAADIRPDTLNELSQPNATQAEQGEEMIREMARHHGAATWLARKTYSVVATDTWKGLLGRSSNPWPHHTVNVKLDYEAGSFNGRAEFLDGKSKGDVWEVSKGIAYETEDGVREVSKNDDIGFIIPALQFLTELPIRAAEIPLKSYAGKQTLDDVEYDAVFATWHSFEPNGEDQYLLFLDTETRELKRATFTIREAGKIFKSSIYYDDYRELDGVKFPFRMTIRFQPEGPETKFVHQVIVESVTFPKAENVSTR